MAALRLADTVSIAEDEHGAVLLESHSGTLFGLSPTAALYCGALANGADQEAAVQAVLEAFDADEQIVRSDLADLATELLAQHLATQDPS